MNATNKLKTALIQADLIWGNPTENRNHFEEKINKLPLDIDLIILPEMFTTGFSMNAHNLAETMTGNTIIWMQDVANKKQAAIVGSVIIKEPCLKSDKENNYYNRLLFVHPSGKVDFYDKKHLFTLAGEDKMYSAGKNATIIDYKGWKIYPLICYDLRFPVWARNSFNYDLLLYVANWPIQRIEAWDTLLKARAIENMSYTIGVNRIGTDPNGYEYNGNSAAYDMLGKCIIKNTAKEISLIIDLDKGMQCKTRSKFRFLDDKDKFTIQ